VGRSLHRLSHGQGTLQAQIQFAERLLHHRKQRVHALTLPVEHVLRRRAVVLQTLRDVRYVDGLGFCAAITRAASSADIPCFSTQ
jgi:hypothetical protein